MAFFTTSCCVCGGPGARRVSPPPPPPLPPHQHRGSSGSHPSARFRASPAGQVVRSKHVAPSSPPMKTPHGPFHTARQDGALHPLTCAFMAACCCLVAALRHSPGRPTIGVLLFGAACAAAAAAALASACCCCCCCCSCCCCFSVFFRSRNLASCARIFSMRF